MGYNYNKNTFNSNSQFGQVAQVGQPHLEKYSTTKYNRINHIAQEKPIDSFSNESITILLVENKDSNSSLIKKHKQCLLIVEKPLLKPVFPKILKPIVEIEESSISTKKSISLVATKVSNSRQSINNSDFKNLTRILIISQFFITYRKLFFTNFEKNKNFTEKSKKSQNKLLKLKILCPPIKNDIVICCTENLLGVPIEALGVIIKIRTYPYAICRFKKNSIGFYTVNKKKILTDMILSAKETGLIVSKQLLIDNGLVSEFLTFLFFKKRILMFT